MSLLDILIGPKKAPKMKRFSQISSPSSPLSPPLVTQVTEVTIPGEKFSTDQCPPLPRGVRMVRYEPKSAPVAIDVCSIVGHVEKFIRAELRELDARLHSPVQIRGGWGVFTILDRLRQVGLELEIDATLGGGPDGTDWRPKNVRNGF